MLQPRKAAMSDICQKITLGQVKSWIHGGQISELTSSGGAIFPVVLHVNSRTCISSGRKLLPLFVELCSWDRTTARITFMTAESQKELSIPLL
jgi:hypothetical protein